MCCLAALAFCTKDDLLRLTAVKLEVIFRRWGVEICCCDDVWRRAETGALYVASLICDWRALTSISRTYIDVDHWRNPWSSYVYCQVALSSVSRVGPCRTPLRNRTRRRARSRRTSASNGQHVVEWWLRQLLSRSGGTRTDRQSATQSTAGATLGKCIGVQYTSQETLTELEWLRSVWSQCV